MRSQLASALASWLRIKSLQDLQGPFSFPDLWSLAIWGFEALKTGPMK